MLRAIIVSESLLPGSRILAIEPHIDRRYGHSIAGLGSVEIVEATIPESSLRQALTELVKMMKPKAFYGHIWSEDTLYVCFPNTVAVIGKGDQAATECAQRIGALFSIPLSQMQFQAMFQDDHPDHSDG